MMMVYFENLKSFGIKMSLVSSSVFGVKDFLFTTIRGIFITLPIFFIRQEEHHLREYQQTKTRIKNSIKRQLQKQSKGTLDHHKYKQKVKEKLDRVPNKMFFITNPKKTRW